MTTLFFDIKFPPVRDNEAESKARELISQDVGTSNYLVICEARLLVKTGVLPISTKIVAEGHTMSFNEKGDIIGWPAKLVDQYAVITWKLAELYDEIYGE